VETQFDIVIVGGGLAGASLACALRDSGLSIAIIEAAAPLRQQAPAPGNERTLALAYGSRRIFESMGVWPAIEALGVTPIARIHVSHRGSFGAARLEASEAQLPALGYVVENHSLGTALVRALDGARGVTWFCPASLETLERDNEAVVATVRHGDSVQRVRTRLVIGADGTHSAVRRLVGVEPERTDYEQVAIVTTVAAARAHENTAYERFTDSGPLALLPMRNQRCAVVWSARAQDAGAIAGWDDRQFLERLQERFGDRLGRLSRPGARVSYPLGRILAPAPAQGRVVLIGNAAHTVHPVAGQGFNLGLRDVATLAEVLLEARRAGHDVGAAEVIARYVEQRARDTRVVSTFTDGLVRVFSNEFPPLALARGLGLLALDVTPTVKRRLVRMTSGLGGRLPRLARGLPLS
jgi:2-octaprenyl-6-methoxyphenol hydroxylase